MDESANRLPEEGEASVGDVIAPGDRDSDDEVVGPPALVESAEVDVQGPMSEFAFRRQELALHRAHEHVTFLQESLSTLFGPAHT